MTCHVTWQDNPLRVTEGALNAKIIGYFIIMNPDRQNYPDFIRVI